MEEIVGNQIAAGQVPVQIVRKIGQNYAVDSRFTELMEASQLVLAIRQEVQDANVRRVAARLEAMDKQLDQALVSNDTKTDAALHSEVRNHLRSSENPAALAMEAARLGDMQFIQSVLTTSPTLMGRNHRISREVIEAALAYGIEDKAEAAYARSDLFDKRLELMNSWAKASNVAHNIVT